MKKIITIVLALSMINFLVSSVFADNSQQKPSSNKKNFITAFQQLNSNDPNYNDLIAKRDNIVSLRKEHTDLVNNIKTQAKINKELRQQIKNSIKSGNKNTKELFQKSKKQLKENTTAYKNLNKTNRNLRQNKKTAWKTFRSSIKENNYPNACSIAQNIIDTKQSIIDNANKKLSIQKELNTILKLILNSSQ